jgi:hypothetical protein
VLMGQVPRTRDLWRSRELPTGQGPRTRDLRTSQELPTGPSPQRSPWAALTRESWGPQVQSSCQAQRAGSSLGLHQWKWTRWTPPRRARTIQHPVYFISEVLHEAKTRYLEAHKLLYAVLITSGKLRHYFQAHRISVVTSYPLRAILCNPNATGNIAKCVAELAEFELDFVPLHVVKSQVLADFIVDWTPSASPTGGPEDSEPDPRALVFTRPHWTLFFNGSSRK